MSFQLTIEPLGQTIEVEEGQRMLDACLRAGVWLPYACNHGLCGTCKVQVVDGDIEQTVPEYLEKNPDDLEGWTMLARSRLALGQYRSLQRLVHIPRQRCATDLVCLMPPDGGAGLVVFAVGTGHAFSFSCQSNSVRSASMVSPWPVA